MAKTALPWLPLVVGLLVTSTQAVSAQGRPSTLSATGVQTTSLKAEKVRIAIPLFAQTLNTADSLELMRERKSVARQRAIELLCDGDSIRFSGVQVSGGGAEEEFSAASMRMLNAMGNQIDVDELPTLITVRSTMTADWLLPPGADEEAVLGIVEEIVANLKEPDVTGKNDRPEFTPRVEEALKTLQSQTRSFSNVNRGADVNEIRYAFVAAIDPELQRSGIRAAFEDAKAQIDDLAAAAGLGVGGLLSLNNNNSTRYGGPTITRSYNGYPQLEVLQARDNEVLAPNVSELEYSARVSASFSVTE